MIDYRRNLHDTAPGFPFIEISPLALLTDPQGNILLARDKDDGYWRLPGGWLSPNETVEECLQRSVLSNCSILLETCCLMKVFSGADLNYVTEDTARVSPVYMLFFPKRIRGSLRTKPRDGSEIRFFAPWNIPMEQVFPPMQREARYYIDNFSDLPVAQALDWDRYPDLME